MSVLDVRLDYADKLKDTEVLGRQDPYCILQLGTATSRSRTCTDGGTRPVWNETFRFNNVDHANDLLVTIKNENVLSDDVIGMCRVPLQKLSATRTSWCASLGKGLIDDFICCFTGMYSQSSILAGRRT
eukprot:gene6500-6728_t